MSNEETPYMLAQCGTYDKPLEVTRALRALAEQFPVVAPGGTTECHVVPEGYGVSVTAVIPTEDDVYKDKGSNATCFKATFLKKLAAGLGIEWVPSETRRLDNFAHPFVCSIVVAGRYRDWSGEWRTISGSHMLDLRDEAAHGMTDKQLPMARKNIAQLCETKAKSRAIADACISRTIDPRDLNRPIPMAKLYRRDTIDSGEAKRALYGEPRRVAADVIDVEPTTVEDTPQGNTGRPSSEAPVASPTRESGASSVETGPSPAAASPAGPSGGSKSKPGCVHLPGHPEDGRTFAAASDDALRAYLDALATRIAAGRPGKMLDAMQAKYDEAEAVLLARRETTEGVPF